MGGREREGRGWEGERGRGEDGREGGEGMGGSEGGGRRRREKGIRRGREVRGWEGGERDSYMLPYKHSFHKPFVEEEFSKFVFAPITEGAVHHSK